MSRGIFVALILRVSVFAVGGLASLMMPSGRHLDGGLGSFAFLAGLAAVQIAILHFALLRPQAATFAELGWRGFEGRDLLLGLVGGAACVGIMFGVFGGLGRLEVRGFLAEALERPIPEELLWVGVGLLAAFVEETVYRGHLQPIFVEKWGRLWGILACAALFSAFHFQPAPLPFLTKLGVGVVLGLLRERTGTLWAAGLAHTLIWVVFGMS
jgi:membrane protease YdiL (CAAX protease family)